MQDKGLATARPKTVYQKALTMRKAIVYLLVLLVFNGALAQTAGTPGIGDDFYPELGNGGYDVQLYRIQLDVSDDLSSIVGATTLEIVATQDLSAFNLDFLGMTIDSIEIDEQSAQYSRDGRELTVTPAAALTTGSVYSVRVAYHGTPGTDEDGDSLQFNNGWFKYDTGVLVASEPDGSAVWFPANDHPLDKAKFQFVISVPAPFVVAANGTLSGTTLVGDRTTYTWEMNYPMATYLATVNIQTFEERTDMTASGVKIRNYFPAAIADEGEATFARQADMIDYFETVFGSYPFDVYGVVVADIGLGFALETQTLSLFGKNIVVNGTSASGIPAESIIAHELAHQWFGNSLTPATWRDLWLNEGFASYAQVLWVEHEEGAARANELLVSFYAQIRNPLLIAQGGSAPGTPPPERLFNTSVYLRGAWVLHALRLQIGDAAFFKLLRTYADTFQYGNVKTLDFIGMAVAISGDPTATSLLNAWIYEAGVPDVPQMNLFGTN